MQFLQEGDIIELDERHKVYARRSIKFYGGGVGMSNLETPIKLFPEYKGRYLVVKTLVEGGGTAHGPHDRYPDGHHVYCVKLVGTKITETKVDFYQSGCFTCMITDIKPVGKARKEWLF